MAVGFLQRKGDERVVYKLHGSFDDPEPNLVISEDDYIAFLGIAADEKLGVPRQIKSRIQDSALLFLGYGLEDWDVRTIFNLLIEKGPQRSRKKSSVVLAGRPGPPPLPPPPGPVSRPGPVLEDMPALPADFSVLSELELPVSAPTRLPWRSCCRAHPNSMSSPMPGACRVPRRTTRWC